MSRLRTWGALGVLAIVVQMGGCPGTIVVTQGFRQLEQTVVALQTADSLEIALPDALVVQGDSVVLEPDVLVVSDIEAQLVPVDVAADTVLGFSMTAAPISSSNTWPTACPRTSTSSTARPCSWTIRA